MEPRGRLKPEVTQLWCWGPDAATTTEERLTIDDAAAVRDALRKEAGGDRAPYPAWVSTAWHVLRWDEPSARVSWELVGLALNPSASCGRKLWKSRHRQPSVQDTAFEWKLKLKQKFYSSRLKGK